MSNQNYILFNPKFSEYGFSTAPKKTVIERGQVYLKNRDLLNDEIMASRYGLQQANEQIEQMQEPVTSRLDKLNKTILGIPQSIIGPGPPPAPRFVPPTLTQLPPPKNPAVPLSKILQSPVTRTLSPSSSPQITANQPKRSFTPNPKTPAQVPITGPSTDPMTQSQDPADIQKAIDEAKKESDMIRKALSKNINTPLDFSLANDVSDLMKMTNLLPGETIYTVTTNPTGKLFINNTPVTLLSDILDLTDDDQIVPKFAISVNQQRFDANPFTKLLLFLTAPDIQNYVGFDTYKSSLGQAAVEEYVDILNKAGVGRQVDLRSLKSKLKGLAQSGYKFSRGSNKKLKVIATPQGSGMKVPKSNCNASIKRAKLIIASMDAGNRPNKQMQAELGQIIDELLRKKKMSKAEHKSITMNYLLK